MQIVKQVILDADLNVNELEQIFINNEFIQLKFESKHIFNKIFNKFSSVLYEYGNQIVSLYCPESGNIFEDSVFIISNLEDILSIEIKHVVISAIFDNDIRQLVNFYEQDLKDGSLTVAINYAHTDENSEFWTPINIIAYIERSAILGITMSIDLDEICNWFLNVRLYDSYKPYLSCIIHYKKIEYYNLYNDKYSINYFDKMYILR